MINAIEVTRLVKAGGPLSKRLHLTDGQLANDSSACRMSTGRMERIRLDDWRALATLIEATPRNVAWALGALRDDLPDETRLVLRDDPQAGAPGFVARTADNFIYRPNRLAFVLGDLDTKGMPADIKARIEELGGFAGALATVCPGFAKAGYIRRRSTSANVVNSETGEEYPSAGEHIYLLVQDGADARRFLYALHDRAWLRGLGWHLVGKAGQLLDRSIIDRMVCAPERLVFEAAPDLEPPLKQRPRQATVHDGAPLDTLPACPDLSVHETSRLERLKAAAAFALKPQAEAAQVAFVREQADKAVERGMDRDRARATAEAWSKGVLRPSVTLDFDNKEIGPKTVRDVLADPERYVDEALADPIEGVAYGRQTAKVLRHHTMGDPFIHSFAHGGAFYRLVHDAASIEAAIMAAAPAAAADLLSQLILNADVGLDERKRLCKLAGTRSGAGSRVAEKMVSDALAGQREAAARERRISNMLASVKPRLPAPLPDSEAKPIMLAWDDILANANVAEPPMRDVENWPVAIRQREIAGLHELTSAGSNDDEEPKTRLPSPKTFLLTKHDVYSLEIELSGHMTFVEETADGERAVGAPFRLLTHWLKYRQSNLPTVRAVVTMPLVLPDGELMSGAGLDRERGVVFRIEPDLLRYIPKREDCTALAVARAYRYLTDEWLVDVAADWEGKAVLVAYALSIIERILFPERPTFYVTAGQRGGGKTTALIMLTLAALGVKPAAMAWSADADERKKALYAVLREGAPSLIFDNIPRGAVIGCSHIERASTTEVYKDRVLGVSEAEAAPAFTIIAFTGNNIRPKSDTASRSLIARLSVDRLDPENRPFTHDDPVVWTLDHRGDILNALYTVLLGNPRFADKHRCAPQTRFKAWWHLVGSAVEQAVLEATGTPLSFKEIFERAEADDEDAISRADILRTLHGLPWPTKDEDGAPTFTTADVLERLREIAELVRNGATEEPDMAELRRFCTAPKASAPSPKAITRALKAIEGTPTAVGTAVMTLRVGRDSHSKATIFNIVEHEGG